MPPTSGTSLDFDSLMRLQHLGRNMPARMKGPVTSLPGAFVHRKRGRGLEIQDIRPWQLGDDVRHIDGNVTARTGVQHIRTFRDERDQSLLLVADLRPSMLFGTRRAFRSVAAAEALVLLGWQSTAQGRRVGVTIAGPVATASALPGRGIRNMAAILGLLTRAHSEVVASASHADTPLTSALETAARTTSGGGSIVVATSLDLPGDDFDAVVRWLARRNDLRFAIVRDAFERQPPPGIYPFFTSGEGSGSLCIRGDPMTNADQRCARLRGLGASAIIVDSDVPPEQQASVLEALHV